MSGLNSNNEPRTINNPKALPDHLQDIFFELHGLSGEEYQKKKNEAKIKWDMKQKLSSD